MGERLPLFPLGTVLLPGLLLPLEIFEERYRILIRELLALPETDERRFGVVAIRQGREVGSETPAVYDVGCAALLRRVESHADGRFSIVTVGGPRFRLRSVDETSRPYLLGNVDYLPDDLGDPRRAEVDAVAVAGLLNTYIERLRATRTVEIRLPDLPTEPTALSYLVAAAIITDLTERQDLLSTADTADRLRIERALLRRELGLLARITSIGSSELSRIKPSPN